MADVKGSRVKADNKQPGDAPNFHTEDRPSGRVVRQHESKNIQVKEPAGSGQDNFHSF